MDQRRLVLILLVNMELSALGYINNLIKELYSDEDRPNIRLFYGGSVDENSVEELSSISLLDGFLIGRASADFDKFKNIVNKMR